MPESPTATSAPARATPIGHVSGTGLLASTATELLGNAARADARVLVSLDDRWYVDEDQRRAAWQRQLPWLPVRTELGVVVIGPFEQPGTPGCLSCAEARRHRARADPDGVAAVLAAHRAELADTPSTLLTTLAADTVAELVLDETERAAEGTEPRTAGAILLLDLHTLRVSRHPFLPDPRCADCSSTPEYAEPVAPRPRPKPDPDTYRVQRTLDPARLRARYVDPVAGLIRELQVGTAAGMVLTRAPVRLRGPHRSRTTDAGHGRTRDFASSETVAICEALERYGGLQQGDRPYVVRARYREIAERAIDVHALGMHPAESYRLPGFRYRPFDPEREYSWVTGYSFARRAPVLVPERVAYYGVGDNQAPDPPFVQETSNGAALGSCPEEAILHGLLEVLERDASLLTWYARLPVPRIDPDTASDRTIPMLVEQLGHERGYRVALFDTTTEHGIPSVWAMAVRSDDDPTRPQLCCSAGAHPRAEHAMLSALAELGPILDGLEDAFPRNAERVASMVDDSTRVTQLSDHSLLYADSRAADRLDFLTAPRAQVPIGKAFAADRPTIADDDLTVDLLTLVDRVLTVVPDVVVVDQTTSEHRVAGLSCVKVLVPGMLPMTFGHAHRRLDGLPRLYEAPVRLGYATRRLTEDELDLEPHPFP